MPRTMARPAPRAVATPPTDEALRSPLRPCEPTAGSPGLTARELLRGRRCVSFTAQQLETWLVRVGFAEAAADGTLLPTKLGAEIGASLDGSWLVRDL